MAPGRRLPEEERMRNITAQRNDGRNYYEEVNVADLVTYAEITRRNGPMRKIQLVLNVTFGVALVAVCIFNVFMYLTTKQNHAALEETVRNLNMVVTSSTEGGEQTGQKGGSSYVRWGRSDCSNTSELIYTGFAAGQDYTQTGGASNMVCLPLTPEYNVYLTKDTGNFIYGAEYRTFSNIFERNLHDNNVPCARCYTPERSATIMIPAIRSCPDHTWTKEYEGYLMSAHHTQHAYDYACVDEQPQALPGRHGGADGALFYFVQGSCPSLGKCPGYINYAELTCVVCSK